MGLLARISGEWHRGRASLDIQSQGYFGTDVQKAKQTTRVRGWTTRLWRPKLPKEQVEEKEPVFHFAADRHKDDHLVIQGVDGTKWSLHYPDLHSGQVYLPQVFDFRELQMATRGFHPRDLVGEGGFGKVYKAVLADGRVAAVKQLDRGRSQGDKEFWVEVDMLSRLQSPHVLSVWGYCTEENQRLLVYEYMRNGSLQDQLRKSNMMRGSAPLDWFARLQIALDVACGLQYLHETMQPPIVHGDLKSSNVLLDFDFKAKLADLGLARRMSDPWGRSACNSFMGTKGYCAPDYALTGQLTCKTDVYSFGVVLLELITGRAPMEIANKQEVSLVSWALPMLKDPRDLVEIVDPRLDGQATMGELCQVAAIAALCLQARGEYRPLMSQVVVSLLPLVAGSVQGTEGLAANLQTMLATQQQQQSTQHSKQPPAKVHGSIHRAKLADGRTVVLRELPGAAEKHAQKAFGLEAAALSQVRSPYLLSSWGHCASGARRLLMRDFLPNGNLEEQLRQSKRTPVGPAPLDWPLRLRIAVDCARGLRSLHEQRLVHGNLHASSVLLDSRHNALLSDFGLPSLGLISASESTRRRHVAPELAVDRDPTASCDVYSYGVLLLELIVGRVPELRWGGDLVSWAMSLVTDRNHLAQVADPYLIGRAPLRDLGHVAAIAAMCLQPKPYHRPFVTDLLTSLQAFVERAREKTPPVRTSPKKVSIAAAPKESVQRSSEESVEDRTPMSNFERSSFSSDELQVALKSRMQGAEKGPTASSSKLQHRHVLEEDHEEGGLVKEPCASRLDFMLEEDPEFIEFVYDDCCLSEAYEADGSGHSSGEERDQPTACEEPKAAPKRFGKLRPLSQFQAVDRRRHSSSDYRSTLDARIGRLAGVIADDVRPRFRDRGI